MKRLIYILSVVTLICVMTSCQKQGTYIEISEGEEALGQSGVIFTLDVDKITVPIDDIHIFTFGSKSKIGLPMLLSQEYFSSPEALALNMMYLSETEYGYSFIVVLNLGKDFTWTGTELDADGNAILSFNDAISILRAEESDYPNMTAGQANINVLKNTIHRPTVWMLDGALGLSMKKAPQLVINGVAANNIDQIGEVGLNRVTIECDNTIIATARIQILDVSSDIAWTATILAEDNIYNLDDFQDAGTANAVVKNVTSTASMVIDLMPNLTSTPKTTVRYTCEYLEQFLDVDYIHPTIVGVVIDEATKLIVADRNVGVAMSIASPAYGPDAGGDPFKWNTVSYHTELGVVSTDAGYACANYYMNSDKSDLESWRVPSKDEGQIMFDHLKDEKILDGTGKFIGSKFTDVRAAFADNSATLPVVNTDITNYWLDELEIINVEPNTYAGQTIKLIPDPDAPTISMANDHMSTNRGSVRCVRNY